MNNVFFKNSLLGVTFSRFISLLSSVAVGLLLPKILSVTDYGYLKIFTLYAVYTAFLHFGFVDGILLKIAGTSYDDLNVKKMRSYTRFFISFEVVIFIAMVLSGLLFLNGENLFILSMLAIDMLAVNITSYYQFVSQATQRFKEYSKKNIFVSVAKFLFIFVLVIMNIVFKIAISYRIYLIGIILLDFCMMVWYIIIYKKITFGKSESIRKLKKDICNMFKTGIVLTVSYQVSHFILALDRQFVSVLYSTEEYATYSFAYNIVSMISTMISSISIVLLPMLRRASREYIIAQYKKSLRIVSILMGFALVGYFPISIFISWFLPNYGESIPYIAVVLPSILFTSGITVIMFTMDKVLDMIFDFFKSGLVVLVVGVISNFVAYYFFETRLAISYASLFTMAIWFILESHHIQVAIEVNAYKEFIYIVVLLLLFGISVFGIKSEIVSMFIYLLGDILLTVVFFKRDLLKGLK